MVVLGLDQAPRNIGWAFSSDDEHAVPRWGCWSPPDFGENGSALMLAVHKWTLAKITEVGADAVYFEQIVINKHSINMPVLHAQFAVVKAVEFACAQAGIDCFEVDIASWRKRFLGRGNAPKWTNDRTDWLKDAARRACADRGFLIDNHHAAEAVGIMDYGLYCLSLPYRRRTDGIVARAQFRARRDEVTA